MWEGENRGEKMTGGEGGEARGREGRREGGRGSGRGDISVTGNCRVGGRRGGHLLASLGGQGRAGITRSEEPLPRLGMSCARKCTPGREWTRADGHDPLPGPLD